MKLFGRMTHGNCTETGCCELGNSVRECQRRRKWHRKLHKSEVKRYKLKEKSLWKRLAESDQL